MTTTLATLQSIVVRGESQTLEFRKSTNELHRAGLTLCGFLNTNGGQVIIGVTPKAATSAFTSPTSRCTRARMLGRFEPPARISMDRIDIGDGKTVVVLDALRDASSCRSP
jgi:ATP-dependent DNA helicase RecG